ncbi:MAG TPA: alpha/beta hydrolase [Hyphomicrobiaceae bacterium]|nr:alpha/beta hydrolase [Hyphomicrobiaceae bacterium]
MAEAAKTTQGQESKPLDNDQPWRGIYITTRDGLRIYGRHYPAPGSKLRPVICLAGLTRNSRDFHVAAAALSGTGPNARAVYTIDTRGRGFSEHARDWKDYIVTIEMMDVQDFMFAEGLHGAAVIGTSRGGLLAMVLGAAQPTLIGPVVLNDIGPVIETTGLVRIAGYVGRTPLPPTWDAATAQLAAAGRSHFPAIEQEEWAAVARQWFNEKDGQPAPGYDPKLARTFSAKDGQVPELWPQFLTLAKKPCMVIRGSHSDLLSEATVSEMVRRHPECTSYTVEGQGHAPLLRDEATIENIRLFLAKHDAA